MTMTMLAPRVRWSGAGGPTARVEEFDRLLGGSSRSSGIVTVYGVGYRFEPPQAAA
jgi:hypothetical protein